MEFVDDDRCFLCGNLNPHGIPLHFSKEGTETVIRGTVPWYFQGFQGVVHGGIVASLLDEVMSHSVKNVGEHAVTGTLEVKYVRPCRTDIEVEVRGKIIRRGGRALEVDSTVTQSGDVVARGKAVFVRTKRRSTSLVSEDRKSFSEE